MDLLNKFLPWILISSSSLLLASTPTDTASLNTDIINANTGADTTLNFQKDITLALSPALPLLRPLNSTPNFSVVLPIQTITINGNNFTLSGSNSFRGFFVRGGNVVINNLTFSNFRAIGGTGSPLFNNGGGGGGGGFGGALFVSNGSTVTLNNPMFINSNATGGAGGTSIGQGLGLGGGGGGGFLGNGGAVDGSSGASGGGGFAFAGGASEVSGGGGGGTGGQGFDATLAGGGNGGVDFGLSAGGTGGASNLSGAGGPGLPGPSGTGGGGGGDSQDAPGGVGGLGGFGGGGGGGAAADNDVGGTGGMGGYGGGGGGGGQSATASGPSGAGGAGGFAGGGGGGAGSEEVAPIVGGTGGIGGFGGGGGGAGGGGDGGTGGVGGAGGHGGGNGAPSTATGGGVSVTGGGGGGGAGFGGAIFIERGGALTINGSATFQGNTVTGGAGGFGATGFATTGSAAGADIYMMSSGSITFNITSNVNIPNPIQGDTGAGGGSTTTGGLTKAGCARLTLNGANTYTGPTVVEGGELRIDGSVTSNIQVQNGAILSGIFSTTGNVSNSGFISPGNGGIGQISMNNFVNQPTGTVVVDITPSGAVHDTLMVIGGTATLNGGTLNVVVNAGNYIAGTQYVIINAPTTGTFSAVTQSGVNAGAVNFSVSYSSVILTVLNHVLFQNQTINPGIPSTVASCLVSANLIPGSDLASVVQDLGMLTDSQLNKALYNLSPANFGTLDWINARNNSFIADIIANHLTDFSCSGKNCEGWTASSWIDVYANLMNNRRFYDNLGPYNADGIGAVTGFDLTFEQRFKMGLGAGYTHTWLEWKGHRGHANINSYYGAAYSNYQGCWFNVDISAIGGRSDYHLKRQINIQARNVQASVLPNLCGGTDTNQIVQVVNIDRFARSHPRGYFGTGHIGLSAKWGWCNKTIEPFALADYHYFHLTKFNEQGANTLDLNVRKHTQHILRGEAGLKLARIWEEDCYCSTPYIGLSWVGEFPLGRATEIGNFTGQSCAMNVTSYHSAVNLLSPQFGVNWTSECGLSFSFGYKGLFNHNTRINEIDAQFEWVY